MGITLMAIPGRSNVTLEHRGFTCGRIGPVLQAFSLAFNCTDISA
jgi:hypothetical protein